MTQQSPSPSPGPLVVVGSLSPSKLDAVAAGFELIGFSRVDVRGLKVPDAPDQPMADEVTLAGAEHRADVAMAAEPAADYWVGIEGGLENVGLATMLSAWIVVRTHAMVGRSRSASYEIPAPIAGEVRSGHELGTVAAEIRTDAGSTTGLVGTLTDDRITRQSLYIMPVALALMRLLPAWTQVSALRSVRNGR